VRVDLDALEGVEEGGRVSVRFAAVATTYLPDRDESLARGRFVSHDLGVFRNGELALVGRLDDLVNVKGKKVNPKEVEAVISGLPEVDEVCALGIPGKRAGQQTLRVVVACAPRSLVPEDLLSHCRSRLSDYKVPRSVVFVESLPRTPRGKIDRIALLGRER
jgi:long-chain acyl-CoA synthetase